MDKGVCYSSRCSNSNWNNCWCANLTSLAWFRQNCWASYFCSLQIEIFAFFLEALFMSIYVYATDKLPPFMRLISLFFVMLGATASAVLITSANTWMNTPAGFSMNPDGSVFNVDPWKAFFNQVLAQVHFMSLLRLMQPVRLSLLLLLDLNY